MSLLLLFAEPAVQDLALSAVDTARVGTLEAGTLATLSFLAYSAVDSGRAGTREYAAIFAETPPVITSNAEGVRVLTRHRRARAPRAWGA